MACLAGAGANIAGASAIAAVLAGKERMVPLTGRDAFVPLKTAAAAWGIEVDLARKWGRGLARTRRTMATKRSGGRWWVRREALL